MALVLDSRKDGSESVNGYLCGMAAGSFPRFLPFLRNVTAVLAGTNSMAQHSFYFASASAAVAWIICYGLAAYSFGEAFADLVSPAAVFLGLAATLMILAAPVLILRYETCLQIGR